MNYSIKKNNKCQENTLFLWFLPKITLALIAYIIHHFIHKRNTFYYFYGFRKIAKVASTSFEILCFLHHSLTAFEAPGKA